MVNNLPFPSFEDIRKILQFWIEQEDKWFYFEGSPISTVKEGNDEVPNPLYGHTVVDYARRQETQFYCVERIIGKIHDVITFPPSLLLYDVKIYKIHFWFDPNPRTHLISREERTKYGLVFSQITYYEPIDNYIEFLEKDSRINAEED